VQLKDRRVGLSVTHRFGYQGWILFKSTIARGLVETQRVACRGPEKCGEDSGRDWLDGFSEECRSHLWFRMDIRSRRACGHGFGFPVSS
jgi:hypothetical protein